MERTTEIQRPSGLVPYPAADAQMHEVASAVAAGDGRETLIVLEHAPVYTAGRRSMPEHVRWSEDAMREAGAEIHKADRGGSVTFHGPGQLVGYPILDLGRRPDVTAYLRNLEEVVIRAGADVGVELHRSEVQTGVWSGERKVCAIGVKLMRWRVTLHGFGLNCDTDLRWFDAIVPCGLRDTGVASLSQVAGRRVTVEEMRPLIERRFQDVFETRLVEPAVRAA
jgi:lipoyl(octanoyl) transferase